MTKVVLTEVEYANLQDMKRGVRVQFSVFELVWEKCNELFNDDEEKAFTAFFVWQESMLRSE